MFVRKLKRKTTQNIAVQIVRNDRTKDGKVRQRIVRYIVHTRKPFILRS